MGWGLRGGGSRGGMSLLFDLSGLRGMCVRRGVDGVSMDGVGSGCFWEWRLFLLLDKTGGGGEVGLGQLGIKYCSLDEGMIDMIDDSTMASLRHAQLFITRRTHNYS